MTLNSILSNVMESRNHFKNGASPKSQTSKGNNLMKKMSFFYWLFPIIMLSGCATKVPMTTDIINEVGGVENTKHFQYYVSKKITLNRVDKARTTTIEGGQLIRKDKTARDKIVIGNNLPGVVRSGWARSGGFELQVAFENYDGDPVLHFGQYPNENTNTPYKLFYQGAPDFIVQYGDNRYKVSFDEKPHTGQPYLLIKMKKSATKSAQARKAKGVKLGK